MSTPENFREALTRVYRENPCQVLPNALWKSLPWADCFETDFKIEGEIIRHLMAWDAAQLMLYWDRDGRLPEYAPWGSGGSLEFALLHRDFDDLVRLEDFSQIELYFRLIHKMEKVPEKKLPDGFSFAIADPQREAQEISTFIAACYEELHPTAETVQGWTEHPVFDASLWVWLIEEGSETPAGLGIAEFDPGIAEGSLEWIQVLPTYRGRGLGKQIVYELLRRLEGRATFTSVAGQMDNQTQPEKLYRSCGFEGNDLWHVLRK